MGELFVALIIIFVAVMVIVLPIVSYQEKSFQANLEKQKIDEERRKNHIVPRIVKIDKGSIREKRYVHFSDLSGHRKKYSFEYEKTELECRKCNRKVQVAELIQKVVRLSGVPSANKFNCPFCKQEHTLPVLYFQSLDEAFDEIDNKKRPWQK